MTAVESDYIHMAVAHSACGCTGWLEERIQSVYTQDPTYKASAAAPFALDPSPPEELPDALKGEQWSFVQLPLGMLQEELEDVREVRVLQTNECV